MANTINITVDKASMGLDQVNNTSDLNKPISTATQTALNGKENVSNKSTNTSLGTSDTLYPSQKAVKTYVDSAISGATVPTLAQVTASGNATSTPISVLNATFNSNITPSQIATLRGTKGVYLDAEGEVWVSTNGNFKGKIKSTDLTAEINLEFPNKTAGTYTIATTDLKGAANGLAELDGTGKVPSSQLPSFVDDVVDYANLAAFPVTGESGKIYIALDTNLTYRWSGSVYVEISPSLALGETSASAYRGDRGKIAYDHSQSTGNPHGTSKSDIGLGNVVNADTTTTLNITDSTNKRFVTDAEKTILSNTSGTNTGDETQSTIKTKLGAATTSVDGYLTSTDWNTFNGKQNALGFTAENVANKSTDLTASATKYPTVNAVNTGLGLKENTITAGTTSQYFRGDKTFQTLDKTAVGLGNVDNTSDANKPISTATQTALDNKSDKNITLNRQTASYVGVASDNGKLVEMNVASANTFTINTGIYSAGNQILISQYGSGQTTITAGAGVTLRSSGGKLKTSVQYSLVTIIAISSTEFYVAGDLTA